MLVSLTALGATNARERIDGYVLVEQGSRFVAPACVGDTLTPRLTVERAWTEGGRRFCRFTTTVLNQRGETLLEGFHVYRVLERKTT